MKRMKVIKTDKGRVTIQRNSFGIPEIKVRLNGVTYKIRCQYEKIDAIEEVVNALLYSIKS